VILGFSFGRRAGEAVLRHHAAVRRRGVGAGMGRGDHDPRLRLQHRRVCAPGAWPHAAARPGMTHLEKPPGFPKCVITRPSWVSVSSAGGEQHSVATPQAARGWARPPCRHFNIQSCLLLLPWGVLSKPFVGGELRRRRWRRLAAGRHASLIYAIDAGEAASLQPGVEAGFPPSRPKDHPNHLQARVGRSDLLRIRRSTCFVTINLHPRTGLSCSPAQAPQGRPSHGRVHTTPALTQSF
jgi:hypothetical protein